VEKEKRQWWERLGKPEYGGELLIRANTDIVNFDPYNAPSGNIHSAWMERLVSGDWTLDPAVFDFLPHWHPSHFLKGQLAESWEFTEPGTYVAHLRKGIHWQNIPPASGREFNADDVVFHYQRMCGLGPFTKPSQQRAPAFEDLVSVTAADRYTVVFKWKVVNQEFRDNAPDQSCGLPGKSGSGQKMGRSQRLASCCGHRAVHFKGLYPRANCQPGKKSRLLGA
jgi:ABC-type transport system substrate-binding protein